MGELADVVKNVGFATIGLGVAFGYALLNLATGVAFFVDGLLTHVSSSNDYGGQGLTWVVDRHVISLDALLTGAIELAIVLAVAAYLRRPRADA